LPSILVVTGIAQPSSSLIIPLQRSTAACCNTDAGKTASLAPPKDIFYEILKSRCQAKLKDRACPRVADATRLAWYLTVLCLWIISFICYAKGSPAAALLFPLASWLMGSLGHDASHFSLCKHPSVNHFGTMLGMAMIASPMMWYHQHTYAHHSHTTEHEVDPDLHHRKSFRLNSRVDHCKIHGLQASRIYTYAHWSMTAIGDALVIPVKSVLTGFISDTTEIGDAGGSLGGSAYSRATLVHNAIYLLIVGAPVCSLGPSGMVSVLMQIAISGWLFGFFSQINHINEDALAGAAEEDHDGNPRSWAKRQVESSVNWANESTFWFLLSNGLNYQIEHHLFPGINQSHLKHIAPVVRDTCEEFGVKYNAMPSFSAALWATAEWYSCLSSP